jgi:hypothetical protein
MSSHLIFITYGTALTEQHSYIHADSLSAVLFNIYYVIFSYTCALKGQGFIRETYLYPRIVSYPLFVRRNVEMSLINNGVQRVKEVAEHCSI